MTEYTRGERRLSSGVKYLQLLSQGSAGSEVLKPAAVPKIEFFSLWLRIRGIRYYGITGLRDYGEGLQIL